MIFQFFLFYSNIDFKAPFEVDRSPLELHYTYLDTMGRPVVIAHKKNLVEQHIQDFEVGFLMFLQLFNHFLFIFKILF